MFCNDPSRTLVWQSLFDMERLEHQTSYLITFLRFSVSTINKNYIYAHVNISFDACLILSIDRLVDNNTVALALVACVFPVSYDSLLGIFV